MKHRLPFLLIFFLLCLTTGRVQATTDGNAPARINLTAEMKKADSCLAKGNQEEAARHLVAVAGRYNEQMNLNDSRLCADAYNKLGNINFYYENYNDALSFYMKSLQISEKHDLTDQLSKEYNNIANIYSALQDSYQAYEYYKTALSYAAQHPEGIELKILINITAVCTNINKIDEAWKYYHRMISYENDSLVQGYYKPFCKAIIYSASKQPEKAIPLLHEAIDYTKRNNLNPQFESSVYSQFGNLYSQLGKADSAFYYFRKNDAYTREKAIPFSRLNNLKAYYRFCQQIGENSLAASLRNQYLILSDSIFDSDSYNKAKNAQIVHEMNKNLARIKQLNEEHEKKQQQINKQRTSLLILLCGVLTLAVFLTIVYLQKRKLHLAYTDLFKRNAKLQQLEETNRLQRKEYQEKIATLEDRLKQAPTAGTAANDKPEAETQEKSASTSKISTELRDDILNRINHIMEETDEFCDSDFSLERLASLVDSNSKYVSVVINDVIGKNFRTFVNEYRIQKACARLLDMEHFGNYTIRAIGESVGYKSYTNFTDIFKRTIGIPPSIYQRIALENKESHISDS